MNIPVEGIQMREKEYAMEEGYGMRLGRRLECLNVLTTKREDKAKTKTQEDREVI